METVQGAWDQVGGRVRLDDPALMASLLPWVSPDVEVVRAHHPLEPVVHGHEGLTKALAEWANELDDLVVTLERVLDAGDKVVAVTRWSGTGRTSGASFDVESIDVLTFARGQVVRWEVYLDRAEALKAAGLQG